jgi:hypothetical protein
MPFGNVGKWWLIRAVMVVNARIGNETPGNPYLVR